MTESLSKQLKKQRLRQNITVRQLSKIIGIGFSTISRIEREASIAAPHVKSRIERWLKDGLGSPPQERNSKAEPWYIGIEKRLARLEDWRKREDNVQDEK